MRDELRVGTTFDGFNMGSRKEGYYIGNWPWQGKSQDPEKRVPYCTYALDHSLLELRRLAAHAAGLGNTSSKGARSALEARLANLSSETYDCILVSSQRFGCWRSFSNIITSATSCPCSPTACVLCGNIHSCQMVSSKSCFATPFPLPTPLRVNPPTTRGSLSRVRTRCSETAGRLLEASAAPSRRPTCRELSTVQLPSPRLLRPERHSYQPPRLGYAQLATSERECCDPFLLKY
jgi:hypothetical protein